MGLNKYSFTVGLYSVGHTIMNMNVVVHAMEVKEGCFCFYNYTEEGDCFEIVRYPMTSVAYVQSNGVKEE